MHVGTCKVMDSLAIPIIYKSKYASTSNNYGINIGCLTNVLSAWHSLLASLIKTVANKIDIPNSTMDAYICFTVVINDVFIAGLKPLCDFVSNVRLHSRTRLISNIHHFDVENTKHGQPVGEDHVGGIKSRRRESNFLHRISEGAAVLKIRDF